MYETPLPENPAKTGPSILSKLEEEAEKQAREHVGAHRPEEATKKKRRLRRSHRGRGKWKATRGPRTGSNKRQWRNDTDT